MALFIASSPQPIVTEFIFLWFVAVKIFFDSLHIVSSEMSKENFYRRSLCHVRQAGPQY